MRRRQKRSLLGWHRGKYRSPPGSDAAAADDVKHNMYGCSPCPDCTGVHRWPTLGVHPEHPSSIVCDDCGRAVPYMEPLDGRDPTYEEQSVARVTARVELLLPQEGA